MTGNRSTSGTVRIGVTAALLAVLPLTSRAVDEGRLWRVYRGDVRIICPLTVGGSFEIRTTSIVGSVAPRSHRDRNRSNNIVTHTVLAQLHLYL